MSAERTDEFVVVDGTELRYSAWGDPESPPVVCVHGLSRVGRDFDFLCERLADEYRLLCPDMPGRGLSEWADEEGERTEPDTLYTGSRMAELIVGFFDELGIDSARYVGTSMGGQLGIALAAGALRERISHLVVNDVGPAPAEDEDAQEGIERIIEYLTNPPRFDRLTDLEEFYRETYSTFSPLTDAEWRVFTVGSARRTEEGEFTPAYDPRIVEPLLTEETDADPWAAWESLDLPTLVLKGERSDILADETFERMTETRPGTETRVYDCGHAPSLNVPEQVDPIRELLAR
jgi:pimeloyl-ACP methyl ester carboxylesterase